METPLENILMTFNKKEMMAWLEAHPESFEEAITSTHCRRVSGGLL